MTGNNGQTHAKPTIEASDEADEASNLIIKKIEEIVELNPQQNHPEILFKDSNFKLLINQQVSIDVSNEVDGNEVEELRKLEDKKMSSCILESEKELDPVADFSEREIEALEKIVKEKAAQVQAGTYSIPFNEVSKAVETILSEQKDSIPNTFYKGINPEESFGVERFLLDRFYYLPNLLDDTKLTHTSGINYLVSSEQKDRSGNSIKLEHRFQATSEQEAVKLYEKISKRLAGVQQKIWLACWSLGNKLKKFTYTCQLTDLMYLTYPERNGYFSVSDKIEFYEHLKSLEQTRFVFSKPYKKGNRKKELRISYNIPLLSIPFQLGEGDKYPQQITLSIRSFDPDPVHEKISYVGAEIKHKTLELHADDMQLATWVQTRKAQRQKEEFIEVDLEFLFKLAGLERTAATNKGEAKRLLKKKLERCVEKGFLLSYPQKLNDPISLKVREKIQPDLGF